MSENWVYEGNEFVEIPDIKDYIGFVYLITNKIDGRKYIGKKLFYCQKTKQVKGKKKRYKAQSDWRDYYGSSPTIQIDVANLGKDKFDREILHLCQTKAECNYLEAWEQFVRNVLVDDMYYNDWISARVTSRHLQKVRTRVLSATS